MIDQLEKMHTDIKVLDQKLLDTRNRLEGEIIQSRWKIEEKLQDSLRAEIQVATNELESRLTETLKETEKRLNSRITRVGDLITEAFTTKLVDHEKRIGRLEHFQKTA